MLGVLRAGGWEDSGLDIPVVMRGWGWAHVVGWRGYPRPIWVLCVLVVIIAFSLLLLVVMVMARIGCLPVLTSTVL